MPGGCAGVGGVGGRVAAVACGGRSAAGGGARGVGGAAAAGAGGRRIGWPRRAGALAGALLDEAAQQVLGGVLDQLPPGDSAEVVLSASGAALSLPVELIRLRAGGGEVGPLGLLAGVSVAAPPGRAGPRTGALPARGAAVGAGAGGAAEGAGGGRRAGGDQDRQCAAGYRGGDGGGAGRGQRRGRRTRRRRCGSWKSRRCRRSARRWPGRFPCAAPVGARVAGSVELEDEDGGPVAVTTGELMGALRHAGRPVPLIVLSSCSGGAAGSQAMAAGLVGAGRGPGDRDAGPGHRRVRHPAGPPPVPGAGRAAGG